MVGQAVLTVAINFIAWPSGIEEVATVVEQTAKGTDGPGSVKAKKALARNRLNRLTKRAREVFADVAGGLSLRGIDEKLSISPRTREMQRHNMLGKLGANHASKAIGITTEAHITQISGLLKRELRHRKAVSDASIFA